MMVEGLVQVEWSKSVLLLCLSIRNVSLFRMDVWVL